MGAQERERDQTATRLPLHGRITHRTTSHPGRVRAGRLIAAARWTTFNLEESPTNIEILCAIILMPTRDKMHFRPITSWIIRRAENRNSAPSPVAEIVAIVVRLAVEIAHSDFPQVDDRRNCL